jgi:hypothetical protein
VGHPSGDGSGGEQAEVSELGTRLAIGLCCNNLCEFKRGHADQVRSCRLGSHPKGGGHKPNLAESVTLSCSFDLPFA